MCCQGVHGAQRGAHLRHARVHHALQRRDVFAVGGSGVHQSGDSGSGHGGRAPGGAQHVCGRHRQPVRDGVVGHACQPCADGAAVQGNRQPGHNGSTVGVRRTPPVQDVQRTGVRRRHDPGVHRQRPHNHGSGCSGAVVRRRRQTMQLLRQRRDDAAGHGLSGFRELGGGSGCRPCDGRDGAGRQSVQKRQHLRDVGARNGFRKHGGGVGLPLLHERGGVHGGKRRRQRQMNAGASHQAAGAVGLRRGKAGRPRGGVRRACIGPGRRVSQRKMHHQAGGPARRGVRAVSDNTLHRHKPCRPQPRVHPRRRRRRVQHGADRTLPGVGRGAKRAVRVQKCFLQHRQRRRLPRDAVPPPEHAACGRRPLLQRPHRGRRVAGVRRKHQRHAAVCFHHDAAQRVTGHAAGRHDSKCGRGGDGGGVQVGGRDGDVVSQTRSWPGVQRRLWHPQRQVAQLHAPVAHGAGHFAVGGVHDEEQPKVGVGRHDAGLAVDQPAFVHHQHTAGLQQRVQAVQHGGVAKIGVVQHDPLPALHRRQQRAVHPLEPPPRRSLGVALRLQHTLRSFSGAHGDLAKPRRHGARGVLHRRRQRGNQGRHGVRRQVAARRRPVSRAACGTLCV